MATLNATPINGVVVVAAVGSANPLRQRLVELNLEMFKAWQWACVLLQYRPVALSTHCHVLRRDGWSWGSLVNLSTPMMLQTLFPGYTHVALLLDDIVLSNFSANSLVQTMQQHDIDIASPAV